MKGSLANANATAPSRVIRRGWVGDLLVAFHADAGAGAGRGRNPEPLGLDNSEGIVWTDEIVEGWKGCPVVHIQDPRWQVFLLGELYGASRESEQAASLLIQILDGRKPCSELNGHFLLFGWNREAGELHVITDRFGTMHAYRADSLGRVAIGTSARAVGRAASRRQICWRSMAALFSFGFFIRDWTYFEDLRILLPSRRYVFGREGERLREQRYWQWWHRPDRSLQGSDAVEEFAGRLQQVLDEQALGARIAVPISGGLDSRTTVAALTRPDRGDDIQERLWPFSYGYWDKSPETAIAAEVARRRSIPLSRFTIRPYVFERLAEILSCTEGFQDLTQCRQAFVMPEMAASADRVIAAHWGDVWLDDSHLPVRGLRDERSFLSHALHTMSKSGRAWLLAELCGPQLRGVDLERELETAIFEELGEYRCLEDADFRFKALKTDQWSFRWTTASLRAYQPAAFPRLPFYDTRLTDFFCRLPTFWTRRRRLQVEYLKRYAPDLARIKWQLFDTNLHWYPYYNTLLLPKRALGRAARTLTGAHAPVRNWEVQFLGFHGRSSLEALLFGKKRLHDLVARNTLRCFVDQFYQAPLERGRGYTMSMLVSFAAWLEAL